MLNDRQSGTRTIPSEEGWSLSLLPFPNLSFLGPNGILAKATHVSHFCRGLTQNGKHGYIQSGRGTSVGLFPVPTPRVSWGLWHQHIALPVQLFTACPFLSSYGAPGRYLQCKPKPSTICLQFRNRCSSRSWKTEMPPRGCASALLPLFPAS